MTLEEIGAILRSEREKRHLSIDDVANELKISPRLLRALEAGDGQGLPHHAYARGFIRSYARLLGISPDEVQGWLSDMSAEDLNKPKPAPAGEDMQMPVPGRAPRPGGGGKAFVALLVICCLVGAGYWLWKSGKLPLPDLKKPQSAQEVVENLPGADTYKAARQPAPQPGPAPAARLPEPLPAPERPAAQAEPEPPKEPVAVAEAQPIVEEPALEEATAEPEAAPDQHKLVIIATEECWVHSNADKTDTRQFSLRKGDTFALTFAKSLELKLGNAGGVRLRYDGADLPPPGTSGQVRTITFPPKES